MRHGKRIGVIIPALDEEHAINHVIADIPAWIDDVLVVDNGSRDATGDVARRAGARVILEPQRGYGSACHAGISALGPVDIIVFLDGDYSDRPSEMTALVDPIAINGAKLVIGSRISGKAERGALTPQQRFGNWLACLLMHWLFGSRYTDLGPFRAIDRAALDSLAMTDRAYGWTVEMQIRALTAGLDVREVPVSYHPRIGQSKISGTVKGSIYAGYTILSVIMRAARHRPHIKAAPLA